MRRKPIAGILLCLLGGTLLAGCVFTEGFKYRGSASSTQVMPLEGIEVVERGQAQHFSLVYP